MLALFAAMAWANCSPDQGPRTPADDQHRAAADAGQMMQALTPRCVK